MNRNLYIRNELQEWYKVHPRFYKSHLVRAKNIVESWPEWKREAANSTYSENFNG